MSDTEVFCLYWLTFVVDEAEMALCSAITTVFYGKREIFHGFFSIGGPLLISSPKL